MSCRLLKCFRANAYPVRSTFPLYAPASPRLLVTTTIATFAPAFKSPGWRSSGCSTSSPACFTTSRATSRNMSMYGLLPTARFSDFWNFAVAIICIVLVILRMFRTALRRFTIARALAMVVGFGVQGSGFRVQAHPVDALGLIGADRDRTGNPCLAKAVLSQLSYGPGISGERTIRDRPRLDKWPAALRARSWRT